MDHHSLFKGSNNGQPAGKARYAINGSGAARITGYARLGFYEGSSVALIAIGLPLVVIGSWLGDRVIRRVDPAKFGWLVGGLIFVSGVALLVK